MLFSGIPFLYYFLPAVVLMYFLVPDRAKNAVLLAFSLLFYAWGEPKYVALMLFSILAYFCFGLAIEKSRHAKIWLIVSILTGAVLLGVFKYCDFFIGSFNDAFGISLPLLRLALPIGISFYTFQCMSYTIDVYRGNARAQRDLVDFAAYVALFPQLIAGPIVRYVDVAAALHQRSHGFDHFIQGLPRFLIGLSKKVLLANNLGLLTQLFRSSTEKSVLFTWLYAIAFTLHIYFDFSGYSDMAIGLGRIFGFRFPENFDYPYISRSVTEFWRRWHMTLGGWFRDYVYIPLGGNRVRPGRWVLNILVVWMLTGLWHGAAWNFVVWGLLFALLLVAEKWIPGLKKLPRGLSHLYVMTIVIISFVIFNADSMTQAGTDLAAMFGIAKLPILNTEAIYYLRSYGLILALAAVGATPLPKLLLRKLPDKVRTALQPVILGLLLLICTAYLVDGSYNPFLYFRF